MNFFILKLKEYILLQKKSYSFVEGRRVCVCVCAVMQGEEHIVPRYGLVQQFPTMRDEYTYVVLLVLN